MLVLFTPFNAAAQVSLETVVHSFPLDGQSPTCLIQGLDGNYYGTAKDGGVANSGIVFKMTPSGTVTTLHVFQDGTVQLDGAKPMGLIQASDGNFYGTTQQGGSTATTSSMGQGTIFRMTPAGTVTIMHSFGDGSVANDGATPMASLVQGSDGNFYGATKSGGSANLGAIFRITPGGFVTQLHSFGTSNYDGSSPCAALIQGSDGDYYGTTLGGGTAGTGTAFRMTSAGNLTVLHSFNATFNDGVNPLSALIQATDGNFYGTTQSGGSAPSGIARGTIYKMTPAGTVIVLHAFGNGTVIGDGAFPVGSLIEGTDGNFYGDTPAGGYDNLGMVYKMTPSGALTVLYSFQGSYQAYDGSTPLTPLVQGANGSFYGLTLNGGSHPAPGYGVVFKMTAAGVVTTLHTFGLAYAGGTPNSIAKGVDGNFYGTTSQGGFGAGVAYKMTPAGAVTIIHTFRDGSVPNDGSGPMSLIQASDGYFYGTTSFGGFVASSGYSSGTVFKMSPSGSITILHSFLDGSVANDGINPTSLIQASDGNFYGTTEYGGSTMGRGILSEGFGTVFKITPGGSVTILHSFGDGSVTDDGLYPFSRLVQGKNGDFYGTTSGTVFVIKPSGLINILHLFSGAWSSQMSVSGVTQGLDGNLYGTTGPMASQQSGTIFKITPSGLFSTLHSFAGGTDGIGSGTELLAASDGNFYGTAWGGSARFGNVFKIAPSGVEAVLHVFLGYPNDGQYPNGGLVEGSRGNLYGVTSQGGESNVGSVYDIDLWMSPPTGLTAKPGNARVSLSWTASLGATSYNIYRGTNAYGESTIPIATSISGTTYVNTGLTNGVTYYYRIAAFNRSGNSAEGNQAAATPVATPATPTNLTAKPGNAVVTVSWSGSSGATSYDVYRGTTSYGQSTTPIATGITGTSYTNTGLTNGVSYFYRVAAFNVAGNSPEGNQASAKPIPPPPVPTNLTASAGNAKVILTWTASTGATSYSVFRGTASLGQSATPVVTVIVGTTYTDAGLINGVTYYYRIAAFNGSGHSSEGNQAAAAPVAPPAVPTNLTAVAGTGSVTLNWTASTGAATYNVYRGTISGVESATPVATQIVGTTYTDTGLTHGTTYYYRIAAFNVSGNSAEGNQAFATP